MAKAELPDKLMEKADLSNRVGVQALIKHLKREIDSLKTVFDAIHEGVIIIDSRLRIRFVNDAAINLLGLPDGSENSSISRFLKDLDWQRILTSKGEWRKFSRREIEVLYPRRRILLLYLVPHETNENQAIIILRDITESRLQALETIESEKVHMMSLLAAGVAHEIGNPLNSLHIHLQLLQRQLDSNPETDQEASELIKVAREEVERLNTIITQFLDAVRSVKPELNQVKLKPLVLDTLKGMQQDIKDHGIEVNCSWPEQLPTVFGDGNQLKQAFYNLIKNAAQAMLGGGVLEILATYSDDYVQLEFGDSGAGIDPDNLRNIFAPYFTTKPAGSGLGLMVVERILRENGAELSVESEVGKGSVFTIRFPRSIRRIRLLPEAVTDSEPLTQSD